LWEALLSDAVLGLPVELEAVDRLLDDRRFFEPYRVFFHARFSRPAVPIETYLRFVERRPARRRHRAGGIRSFAMADCGERRPSGR
jgi:hypothetical protein